MAHGLQQQAMYHDLLDDFMIAVLLSQAVVSAIVNYKTFLYTE